MRIVAAGNIRPVKDLGVLAMIDDGKIDWPARGGTAGTPGVCGIGISGDTCFSSQGCPPGNFCQLPATVGEQGTCTASSGGAMCAADDDCAESDACHLMDRKCVTRAALGSSCAQVSCVENASCVRRGAAQICVELADTGGVCSNDMVQAIPCRGPLICARSICISSGRKGEACLGSATMGSCFAGACIEGVCGDQRPDVATCKQDSDCDNSTCAR